MNLLDQSHAQIVTNVLWLANYKDSYDFVERLWFISGFPWWRIAANCKEATDTKVYSGYVEVITPNVLRLFWWNLLTVTEYLYDIFVSYSGLFQIPSKIAILKVIYVNGHQT